MKNRFVSFLAIFLITTLSASVLAKPIPFTLKRGVPEVEVVINGSTKATFIIDTGADHVYIDKTFAEKKGLLKGGKMPMRPTTGMKDKVEAFQIFLKSLEIDDLKQSVVSAVTIDLSTVLQDTSRGIPDGILGQSFLRNQIFILDYKDSTVSFSFEAIDFNKIKTATIPIVMDRHFITVNTLVEDSIKAKMILDTGSSYTVFSPALAKLLGIEDSTSINKINLDNKVTTAGVKTNIRNISAISNVLMNTKINGILGTSFLVQRKILFDYQHNQVIFIAN